MMKLFYLILIGVFSLPVQAAEPIGRLFTTPAERKNLDYLRQTSTPPEKVLTGQDGEAVTDVAEALPSAPPVPVSVQGFVKRTDGKGTVWVNHQPILEKTGKGDLEVGKLNTKNNRVTVRLPSSGQAVELKAGQTYDPVSGKIVEHARDIPVPATPEPTAMPADPVPAPAARQAP